MLQATNRPLFDCSVYLDVYGLLAGIQVPLLTALPLDNIETVDNNNLPFIISGYINARNYGILWETLSQNKSAPSGILSNIPPRFVEATDIEFNIQLGIDIDCVHKLIKAHLMQTDSLEFNDCKVYRNEQDGNWGPIPVSTSNMIGALEQNMTNLAHFNKYGKSVSNEITPIEAISSSNIRGGKICQ